MEYTTLGRTGASVSRLGFGGAPAGLTNYLEDYTPDDSRQRGQVIDAIQRAVEMGVTYFDTAPGYGQGAREEIFGTALAGIRQSIFIATKADPDSANVRASLESSLERLQRDTVDLVQIHGSSYTAEQADAILAPDGMLDQIARLKEEGLTRFIGFTSEDNNPALYRFINSGRFDVIQLAYNLLFQHPYETTRPFGSLFEANRQEMGICTMRGLTSGIFQKWIQMVNPNNTFNYTPALLQFVLSNPLVHVALVGMRDPQMVVENVRICNDMAGRIDLDELHAKYPTQ
jgi:predicted aldo/keto reductase-like oxidoreductase